MMKKKIYKSNQMTQLPRYKSLEIVRRRFRRSFMSSDDERLLLWRFMSALTIDQQNRKKKYLYERTEMLFIRIE